MRAEALQPPAYSIHPKLPVFSKVLIQVNDRGLPEARGLGLKYHQLTEIEMSLKKVRLTLARDPGFPFGSDRHGYEFVAPLQDDGHIDPAAWRKHRADCRVRRFWNGEDDEVGHLVHTKGRRWAFHYDLQGSADDDETGFRFDSHVFKPGEYVSIHEHDGELRTFKVEDVRALRNGAQR